MAYAEHNISSLTEVPALVEAFATTVGWDVASGPILRHPDYEGGGPGGIAFSLAANISGLNHTLTWSSSNPIVLSSAVMYSPILVTNAAPDTPVTQTPTRLFLVGRLDPEPYLAIAVEYGPNLFRHLYLGFMEKIGAYAGGEVISGSGCRHLAANANYDWWGSNGNRFLFSASQTIIARNLSGGVHLDHLDNPAAWRSFRAAGAVLSGGIDTTTFDGGEAIGGFGDGCGDHHVAKGKSAIAGASLLVPINLFASMKPVSTSTRFVPIGNPAGIRMVNIENMGPVSQVTIGGETWRIFPATRRSSDILVSRPGSTSRYRSNESSHYLGYAYRSA